MQNKQTSRSPSTVNIKNTDQSQKVLDLFHEVRQETAKNTHVNNSVIVQARPQDWTLKGIAQWTGLIHNESALDHLSVLSLDQVDQCIEAESKDNPNSLFKLNQIRAIKYHCMNYIAQNQTRWMGSADLSKISNPKVLAILLIAHSCDQAIQQSANREGYFERIQRLAERYLQQPEITQTRSDDSQYLSCQTVLIRILSECKQSDQAEKNTAFENFKKAISQTPRFISPVLAETRKQLSFLVAHEPLVQKMGGFPSFTPEHCPSFLEIPHKILETGDFNQIKTLLSLKIDSDSLPKTGIMPYLSSSEKQTFAEMIQAYAAILACQFFFEHILPVLECSGLGYYASCAYYIQNMAETLRQAQETLSKGVETLEQATRDLLSNKKLRKIHPKSALVSNLNHFTASHAKLNQLDALNHHVLDLTQLLPGSSYQADTVKVDAKFQAFHNAFMAVYPNQAHDAEHHHAEITKGFKLAQEQEAMAFADKALDDSKKRLAEFDQVLGDLRQNNADSKAIQAIQTKRNALANYIQTSRGNKTGQQWDDSLTDSFILVDRPSIESSFVFVNSEQDQKAIQAIEAARDLVNQKKTLTVLESSIETLKSIIADRQSVYEKNNSERSRLESEKTKTEQSLPGLQQQITESEQVLENHENRTWVKFKNFLRPLFSFFGLMDKEDPKEIRFNNALSEANTAWHRAQTTIQNLNNRLIPLTQTCQTQADAIHNLEAELRAKEGRQARTNTEIKQIITTITGATGADAKPSLDEEKVGNKPTFRL